ncbi:glutamine amidotransferase [Polymorphobacter sp. PAMC 29334]|uniref:glutamine amidotransferase n=1 Tax=Polymorphobacter sp. PAMC 29334 TaxID=2862331 RepID=UPI001C77B1A5|nr:glutamine amidotransferase [Polymorphobacter sp. PAMC 29334]QYE33895.1 glutamine amidotransferase [Polymorphobacter sp. PAMC 29334]
MKSCLALRHLDFEDLGVLAAPIEARGYTIRYVDVPIEGLRPEDALDTDLLVVLGGPMNVDQVDLYPWLASERAAITRRLAAGRPALGICLGAQLIAQALGASVGRAPKFEIGWIPMTLSDAGRASPIAVLEGLPVLHWHGYAFDLPAGAVSLASTPLCPQQAFTISDTVLALQFHPEVDPVEFENWLEGNAEDLPGHGIGPEALRLETAKHGPPTAAAARVMIDTWLGGLDKSAV